ncbi:U1 small nuclear ribonucleoprotein 70 kDa [Histomonas meleagridis]|uniref:U1 small nuclear ribonucleoprotein 70 kDa n=1 Tax=Histomonas meleagridis TaxID=135588 RepID=UPI00355A7C82|nr:U1 small nuclear ribonucleoprotein 70 kDa [Histomonas meleagridis]KAH0806908.1 U1 small nuclear ribonucleoprotein 70 kDa [Histomonas meleagridis]
MPPKYAEEITQLFKARPKLRVIKPEPKPAPRNFTGFSAYLEAIKNVELPPPSEPILSINESRIQRRMQRQQANEEKLAIQRANYHPKDNPDATSNPYNTLFLGGIQSNLTEKSVRYELGVFGPIKTVKFVYDKNTGKRRPYCFVEYEKESSFKNAMAQGSKIYFKDENGENRKVIIDCERGRTVTGWLPRRLGGGIGGLSRRFTKKTIVIEKNVKRPKRSGYKYGIRYKGVLAEVSKRRDVKLGIERKSYKPRKGW